MTVKARAASQSQSQSKTCKCVDIFLVHSGKNLYSKLPSEQVGATAICSNTSDKKSLALTAPSSCSPISCEGGHWPSLAVYLLPFPTSFLEDNGSFHNGLPGHRDMRRRPDPSSKGRRRMKKRKGKEEKKACLFYCSRESPKLTVCSSE